MAFTISYFCKPHLYCKHFVKCSSRKYTKYRKYLVKIQPTVVNLVTKHVEVHLNSNINRYLCVHTVHSLESRQADYSILNVEFVFLPRINDLHRFHLHMETKVVVKLLLNEIPEKNFKIQRVNQKLQQSELL